MRSTIPAGWEYSPSSWSCRGPLIALAIADCLIAVYLALYQYDVISSVWEPFFGGGSKAVLNSWLSHVLPVSDAALGAGVYAADAVLGVIGGEDRWRSKPWAVIVFAILVGPVGLTSVGLVIAQPLLFNAWCSLCLLTAILSIAIIGPAMDEALACLQYLKHIRQTRTKNEFWNIFWKGSYVGANC